MSYPEKPAGYKTETNGDLTFQNKGQDIAGWDDLRFPASGINPTGAADAPAIDIVEANFPGSLLFSGTIDNIVGISAQMPHAWKIGTVIRPHIHWSMPTGTADAVTWELYYRKCGNVGETAGAWVGPIAGTLAAGSPEVTNQHCLTHFGDIAMVGSLESAMLSFRLYRRGSTDAASGQARLLEFDIHYQRNKHGTTAEYPAN